MSAVTVRSGARDGWPGPAFCASLTGRPAVVLCGALATAVLTLAASKDAVFAAVPIVAAVLMLLAELVRRHGVGVLLGLLLLGGLNVLPGPDLSTPLYNSITGQDVMFIALVLMLLAYGGSRSITQLAARTPGKWLLAWCGFFLAWYLYTILRTWVTTPVPLLHALTYSRAYVYFAILVPLSVVPLRDERIRRATVWVFVVGGTISCLAEVAAVLSGAQLSFLLHVNYQAQTLGLTRVRSSAAVVPFVFFPFGYGAAIYGPNRVARAAGFGFMLIGLVAIALGLTRAMYLGTAAGAVVATAVAVMAAGSRGAASRRRLGRGLAAILLGGVVLYVALPANLLQTPLGAVDQRATSIVGLLSTGRLDSSLSTRAWETSSIEWALRGHWFTGIGELDPTYDYVGVGGVPGGSINNTDVTLLGGVAMIGIIGIAIYSLPLLVLGLWLLRDLVRSASSAHNDWLKFGGLAFLIALAVASPTIGLQMQAASASGVAIVVAGLLGITEFVPYV